MTDETATTEPGTAELDSVEDWIRAYTLAKEAEKIAKERAEEARSVIAAKLDEAQAEIGTVGGVPKVRWRSIESVRFLSAKFRAAHPDLADEFTQTSTANRMEIL